MKSVGADSYHVTHVLTFSNWLLLGNGGQKIKPGMLLVVMCVTHVLQKQKTNSAKLPL